MAVKKEAGALIQRDDYAVLAGDTNLNEVISANLGGASITPFDLDRVKIPPGGGTSWVVPTLEGEENQKEIKGIIIHWMDKRVYWEKGMEESDGKSKPDCFSEDSAHGVGNPGGLCEQCNFAQFNSAKKGKGQACKQIRVLFIARGADVLPMVVTLPPTSLGPIRKYFMRLASKQLPFYAIESSLTLEKTQNDNGVSYSRVVATPGRKVTGEALDKVKAYRDSIRPSLESSRVAQESNT